MPPHFFSALIIAAEISVRSSHSLLTYSLDLILSAAPVGHSENFINSSAALQSLLATGSKPSFLLSEKIYQKLTGPEDHHWLLRAAEASLAFFRKDILKSEQTW